MRWVPALLLAARAAAATPAEIEFFENSVRPLLVAHCHACHSSKVKTAFAGLRLDSRAAMLRGSDSGAVVIPGDAASSKLIRAVRGDPPLQRMPPAGKLKDSEIAVLEKWVAMGAPWPEETPAVAAAPAAGGFDLQARRAAHWAWQPVRAGTPPPGPQANPIDRFLEAARSQSGLRGAPRATAAVLLRRVHFDLTGLPPSPADVAAFEKDASPAAFARLVDRLLDSPQYGERMARRWMDLVRYSESHGSEGDPDVPQAWRYRDYLIRAFNTDVPYDQLIREHLAGDLLDKPRIDPREGMNESVAGTAHLRMVEHGFQPVDPWEDRVKWTDNQIEVFSKAFQGLTISCARCHDHKFDAISQRDYYALFGIFAGARPTQRAMDTPGRLAGNSAALRTLKSEIRARLAAEWTRLAPALPGRLVPAGNEPRESPAALWAKLNGLSAADFPRAWKEESEHWKREMAERAAFNRSRFRPAFDVRNGYASWTRHGTGAPAAPSAPGEFFVPPAGARAINGVYPAAAYSHLLSQKHGAVIATPRFTVTSDWISFRTLGGNFSNAQLIIENYAVPRGGIYHMRYSPKKDTLGWARWDTTFWKGFTAYIEFATYEDVTHFTPDPEQGRMRPAPKPPRDGRSWFGVQQVVFHDKDEQPREEMVPVAALLEGPDPASAAEFAARMSARVAAAARAFGQGQVREEDAALLDWLVRRGFLPATYDEIPELRAAVEAYRRIEDAIPVARRVPSVVDEGPPPQRLLVRGNHKNFGDPVPQRYLAALGSTPYPEPERHIARVRLAEEVATAANPLTARVMVNRIWQWYFRRGIVATVDNFGKLGDRPTHPELLDWLAERFVRDGWSIRRLTRLVVTSEAYQMASQAAAGAGAADAENRLLWRQNARRLEAEEIRDAILAASGRLDTRAYGPSVDTYYAHDTGKTKGDKPKGPLDGDGRRSVYLEVRRNVMHPFLEVFDVPKPATTRGERDVTTVPAQSLALLNSEFVIGQAMVWAQSLAGATAEARIHEVFLRALGRPARPAERDQALTYVAELAREHGGGPMDTRVWRDFTHSVFNLKEFLYVR